MYNKAVSLLTSQEKFHINLGLERVKELLNYFGNPQDKIKCIHVAGTNGKGSTCAMLASVLSEAGYKTGLYTSPHLVEYTERIKINSEDISREDFAQVIFRVMEQTEPQEQNPSILPGKMGITEVSDNIIPNPNAIFNPKSLKKDITLTGSVKTKLANELPNRTKLGSLTSSNSIIPNQNTIFNPAYPKIKIPATEFEILTAAAFIYFYEKKVDIAVIETGLGGRLDATNVIQKPELSIITDINFDHTARLGNTLEEIAFEKAGIIKKNTPVITLKDNNGLDIIKNRTQENAGALILTDPDEANQFEIGLSGLWQKRNFSLAKKAVDLLRSKGFSISEEAEERGFKNVEWLARFQYIENENIIFDGAHNPSAAQALRQSLDYYFPDSRRIFIYSSLNTKDYKAATDCLFRKRDRVVFTKSTSSASVEPVVIKEYVKTSVGCKKLYTAENVNEAMQICGEIRAKGDLVVFTGSIYTIGEFFNYKNAFDE